MKQNVLYPTVVYTSSLVANSYIREKRFAQVCRWDWLAKYLGIRMGVIMSKRRDGMTFNLFARWPLRLPLGLSQVVTGQMLLQQGFPSLPSLWVRPQNVIPSDSEIIQACWKSDIDRIREILTNRQAHPNDRTPEDLTVFRVCGSPLELVSICRDS